MSKHAILVTWGYCPTASLTKKRHWRFTRRPTPSFLRSALGWNKPRRPKQQTNNPHVHVGLPGRSFGIAAFLHALLVSAAILALFCYWFAVADRYHIFLYNHLDATPFDAITTSRYLMAGLVADGAVLVVYGLGCWFAGRLAGVWYHEYRPPAWWRVWLICLPLLCIGIPAITTTVNAPTLSFWLAAACAAVTCIGLAVALMPGDLAARRPGRLLWIALAGIGLTPVLMLLRAVELPQRGLLTMPLALLFALGGVVFSAAWMGGMVLVSRRLRRPMPSTAAMLLAAVAINYLLLPLIHHLLFTPSAYRYITSGSNFFAFELSVQIVCWLVASGFALTASRFGHSSSDGSHESAVEVRDEPDR